MSKSVQQASPFHQEPVSDRTPLLKISERHEKKRNRRFVCLICSCLLIFILAVAIALGVALGTKAIQSILPKDPYDRAVAILTEHPLIDGHNDLPENLRNLFENQLSRVDLSKNTSGLPGYGNTWHTDIPRLRAGHVGGQFWSAYMPCSTQHVDATRTFMDQVDIIKLMVKKYPDTFQLALSADDIESARKSGHIASMIGVEGGHAVDSSLATLRQFYALGARYMTLTHMCNTPWAHSSTDNGTEGLNDFGRKVVREMNRLGMLVDISHVNKQTMLDALESSLAPVIFSHSSSFALCDVPRNVHDDVLRKLVTNNGIVMVTFVSSFIDCANASNANLSKVADHIDHIKFVAGINHIGIGSDFDGTEQVPIGLEDVSKYPALIAELIKRGYKDDDVIKIVRDNLVRVFKAAEKTRDELSEDFPDNTLIEPQPNNTCRRHF